jgi:hypothetical protein
VLEKYLDIGHHDAVSDLSEHKYFSFVLEGIGDFAFDLKEAAMRACWKGPCSRTSQPDRTISEVGIRESV